MAVGKLLKKVTIRVNVPVAASSGGYTDAYSVLAVTRGELIKNSGARSLAFAEIAGQTSFTLRLRYFSELYMALKMSMVFEIEGREFTMDDWKFEDERRFYILFTVSEKLLSVSGGTAAGGAAAGIQNWTGLTYDQTTGQIQFQGTDGGYYTQVKLMTYPSTGYSYVNAFGEAFTMGPFSGNTNFIQYLTPGQVIIRYKRVLNVAPYTDLTPVTDYVLTVTRLSKRGVRLYNPAGNYQIKATDFPITPINVNGVELSPATDIDDYIAKMNADAANAACFTLGEYVSNGTGIIITAYPVSPYQSFGVWDRKLKGKL